MIFQNKKVFHDYQTGASAELLHHGGNKFFLTNVKTPPEHRRQGGARRILYEVELHLDGMKAECSLNPFPLEDNLDAEDLERFYSHHGFVTDSMSSYHLMVRSWRQSIFGISCKVSAT